MDLTHGWNLAALKDSTFHPARFGRFEWTVERDIFAKQYFPPSLRALDYPPEALVAEMDYAGVDMALLHWTPYLGIGNDFIADCRRRFPERLQGLAYIEEWLIRPEMDGSIPKSF